MLTRNATRDYIGFVPLADHIGDGGLIDDLKHFDDLYP